MSLYVEWVFDSVWKNAWFAFPYRETAVRIEMFHGTYEEMNKLDLQLDICY